MNENNIEVKEKNEELQKLQLIAKLQKKKNKLRTK